MRNITVTVDDKVYRQARVWAAEHDTSLSAVVQYMLSTLRTDWRARAFLALKAESPEIKKPLAPPPPPPMPSEKTPGEKVEL